ncbi:MAG: CoA transferase [Chitinophagia bacterium]|nr:CoA transferase [Chitinophagia bacterium]
MLTPLEGLKVLEFTHAVMGPTTGLLLADAGADVVHIEPPLGDETRRLKGFGTGYFTYYSRNKRSLAIDIKSPAGRQAILRMIPQADVVVENFGPGTMDRLGFGYEALSALNPRIIYCSLKGFLAGPYEQRHAMDEVVQMMGGLAYMTGRPGDPLRAGTSVIDITGGMFGLVGILLALHERHTTGKGKLVKSGLFETTAFLMGQHMAYGAITREPVPPMPARVSAWSVYRIFRTSDDAQVFIGIISEKHWQRFCEAFGWEDWREDPRLVTNNLRIDARDWFLLELENRIGVLNREQVTQGCERASIPFSPIARPEDLFDDPQLRERGLIDTRLPDGSLARLPALPIEYGGERSTLRKDPPRIGEQSREVLASYGLTEDETDALIRDGIVAVASV